MPEEDQRLAGVRARIAIITDPDPTPAELALVGRLLRSFVAKTPEAVERLLDGFPDKDPGIVRDQAHALKGSAANIGATALAALCAALEDQARAGKVPDVAEEIRAEAAAALTAVSTLAEQYDQR
ncbi:Hpt domain-containing protein [Actinoplanes sp. HUAS TT8]|uniref:Hpt domain-containing protein n=1 Tax=Actinoplanes sp. HUAS TT8 TaxID=3447453 RepID=UPI003F522753